MPEDQGVSRQTPKGKRRERLSCAECRRLKLKCDRQVPCQNCIKRQCGDICPEGVRTKLVTWKSSNRPAPTAASSDIWKQLKVLETLLSQHNIPLPKDYGLTGPTIESPSMSSSRRSASPPQSRNQHAAQRLASPEQVSLRSLPSTDRQVPAVLTLGAETFGESSLQLPHHDPAIQPSSLPHQQSPVSSPLWHAQSDEDAPLSANDARQSTPKAATEKQSFGTLMLTHSGGSKYLGPGAASEWLKDQEEHERSDSPNFSRAPTPSNHLWTSGEPSIGQPGFPFHISRLSVSTQDLLSHLPNMEDAKQLVDCYYRYFAWHYDVVPRRQFQPIFDKIYSLTPAQPTLGGTQVYPQQLALVYIVFAIGTLHNLELIPNHPSADVYVSISKACLSKGDFMNHPNIAGVQTLHVMAHFELETEKGRSGDSAWPLWGLAMRIIQAMGLHRDGARWGLDPATVEMRRRVFWECNTADITQANCFSRPSAMCAQYHDVEFPTWPLQDLAPSRENFHILMYETARLGESVLDQTLNKRAPSQAEFAELSHQLIQHERNIPYTFRCRTALAALPSLCPDPAQAEKETPAITELSLQRIFEQHTLALNIIVLIIFHQRPNFMRALHEFPQDPTRSQHGSSYLSVVERCNAITQINTTLFSLYPQVMSRHWFFWYHMFNAAVMMGTLVILSPGNLLAPYAIGALDEAIRLYTAHSHTRISPRLSRNRDYLLNLRQRAWDKFSGLTLDSGPPSNDPVEVEESMDHDLLGWRTRLIQRAATGVHVSKTVPSSGSVASKPASSPLKSSMTQDSQGDLPIFVDPRGILHTDIGSDIPDELFGDFSSYEFWNPGSH